jgi:hypothetical protein
MTPPPTDPSTHGAASRAPAAVPRLRLPAGTGPLPRIPLGERTPRHGDAA